MAVRFKDVRVEQEQVSRFGPWDYVMTIRFEAPCGEIVPIMAAAREFFRQQGGRTSSAVPGIEDGEVEYEVD